MDGSVVVKECVHCISYTLENILDIPANNYRLQALVSTPTYLSVHKCSCIKDCGRTVAIPPISIDKVFSYYLAKYLCQNSVK